MKTIRARVSHAPDVARLNAQVQDLHVHAFPEIFKSVAGEAEIEQFFRQLIADRKNFFYLALVDQQIAGYIWVRIEQSLENPLMYQLSRIYIHHICVDIGHRGKGVASALMSEVENLAGRSGVQQLALDTWAFNVEAKAFFEHKGFAVFNVRMWKHL